jgi:hypothetical protein
MGHRCMGHRCMGHRCMGHRCMGQHCEGRADVGAVVPILKLSVYSLPKTVADYTNASI